MIFCTSDIWGVRTEYSEPDRWTQIRPYWMIEQPNRSRTLSDEDIRELFPSIAERVISVIYQMEEKQNELG